MARKRESNAALTRHIVKVSAEAEALSKQCNELSQKLERTELACREREKNLGVANDKLDGIREALVFWQKRAAKLRRELAAALFVAPTDLRADEQVMQKQQVDAMDPPF